MPTSSALLSLLLVTSGAHALEGMTGQWLPGASPLKARQGWVVAGAAWDWTGPGGDGQGLLTRGVVGVGHRTAINFEGHLALGDPVVDLGAGVRTTVLSRDGFRLAPFGHFEFGGDNLDGYAGLAGIVDGDRVNVDASLSIIQLGLAEQSSTGTIILPPEGMAAFDAGAAIAPASGQELRGGLLYREEQLRFSVGYRWFGDWWLVNADLLLWPDDTSARVTGGLRF